MKYCCEYAYYCATRGVAACYTHGNEEPCCEDEQRHQCLSDMYGSEDGLIRGDGVVCLRCGNYEPVGEPHEPATIPGFPRRHGPHRTSWLAPVEEQ